jgi:L-fuculose-phosphate aldolase
VTLALRSELVATAKRMSALGLTPGMSGNASVRTERGLYVTPSGMPYDALVADDAVQLAADGTARPGQRVPTSEWRLHRDILAARPDVQAIVHTHSLFCTSLSMLRRPLPAVHYSIVLANADEVPCADYATFGSAELATNVVTALRGANACLMANHGMVALGASLGEALKIAAEIETLASQYWHACHLGSPHVLDGAELERVRARFREYGQGPRRRRP